MKFITYLFIMNLMNCQSTGQKHKFQGTLYQDTIKPADSGKIHPVQLLNDTESNLKSRILEQLKINNLKEYNSLKSSIVYYKIEIDSLGKITEIKKVSKQPSIDKNFDEIIKQILLKTKWQPAFTTFDNFKENMSSTKVLGLKF